MKRLLSLLCFPPARLLASVAVAVVLLFATNLRAGTSPELEQCRQLSTIPDEVYNCLDNFLDAMDVDMASYESLVINQLGGLSSEAGTAFSLAQESFKKYRRDNCLWYQAFSQPSPDAGQIAKNCLLEMSRARLDELSQLLEDDASGEEFQGYYVFGDDRNTVVLCGSSERFWVTGDVAELDRLQHYYSSSAGPENALLYVVLTGEIDDESPITSYPGHEGFFVLSRILDARPPRDEDCSDEPVSEIDDETLLADDTSRENPEPASKPESGEEPETSQTTPQATTTPGTEPGATAAIVPSEPVKPSPPPVDKTPSDESETPALATGRQEEALLAYFGAWIADCKQDAFKVLCEVYTQLQGQGVSDILQPALKLTRRSANRTVIDLEFPGQEITSFESVLWKIDSVDLGALEGSRMRINDTAAIQELRQRALIRNVVLPQMIAGYRLEVTVQDDSTQISTYTGTLVGLTRALRFADEFIGAAGN